MEYNTNTYITIAHTTCEALNLGESHRKNNEGTICILEFPQGETIPTEISEHVIDTYTHQEALALVETAEWVRELPF
jgi:hypothetical protein